MEKAPDGKIERIRIPDEEMAEWYRIYREVASNEKEVEEYLSELNPTFGIQKMSPRARYFFDRVVKGVEEKSGRELTEEEKVSLFESIRKRSSKA